MASSSAASFNHQLSASAAAIMEDADSDGDNDNSRNHGHHTSMPQFGSAGSLTPSASTPQRARRRSGQGNSARKAHSARRKPMPASPKDRTRHGGGSSNSLASNGSSRRLLGGSVARSVPARTQGVSRVRHPGSGKPGRSVVQGSVSTVSARDVDASVASGSTRYNHHHHSAARSQSTAASSPVPFAHPPSSSYNRGRAVSPADSGGTSLDDGSSTTSFQPHYELHQQADEQQEQRARHQHQHQQQQQQEEQQWYGRGHEAQSVSTRGGGGGSGIGAGAGASASVGVGDRDRDRDTRRGPGPSTPVSSVSGNSSALDSAAQSPFLDIDDDPEMALAGPRAAYSAYTDMYDGFLSDYQDVFGDRIKLAICVTIFNEEEEELLRTLEGIAHNMPTLAVEQDEVIICIVADGRNNLSKSAIAMGERLGILNADDLEAAEETARAAREADEEGAPIPVPQVHVFENPHTSVLPHTPLKHTVPIMFTVKEKNAGKLSSHRWFFDALCRSVEPEIVYLIDAGTQPKANALEALRYAFEANRNLGGCCGELKVYRPRCLQFVNSAQQFEYKMSHMLDKSLESVFGFVSVLPGAFSAYRYEAVVGTPLDKYFHCEHNAVTSPFLSNMYLAEDRILGFEVLTKAGCKWTLSYVQDSVADTDVPETVVALVKQRRRWLNGAFFTLLYFLLNWWRVLVVTKHSLIRKLGFVIQFFYLVINLALYWFTIGNLYLSFYIVMSITVATEQQMSGLLVGYGALLMIQFVFALGTQAKDFPSIYLWFSVLHGLIMLVTVGSLFTYLALTASTDAVFLIGTVGVASYALVTVVYGEVCFVLSSAIQYLFMVPTFMSVIQVFSFCNLHDCSWGTREANELSNNKRADPAQVKAMLKKTAAQAKRMRRARAMIVGAWLVTNWLFMSVFVELGITRMYAMGVVLAYGAILTFRLIGAIVFRIQYVLFWCCHSSAARRAAKRARQEAKMLGTGLRPSGVSDLTQAGGSDSASMPRTPSLTRTAWDRDVSITS